MDKNKRKNIVKVVLQNIKNVDTKKFILTIVTILLFIVVLILVNITCYQYFLKNKFEKSIMNFSSKNENTVFQIKNITFFSSCDVKNKNASSSNFTIENLYQYTDMALFITCPYKDKTLENTLKKVYIDNIKFTKLPTLGEPKLYYKNIYNFAKSDIIDNNLINDKLDFTITSDDNASLDTPTLYNNLANPIVLSFVNSNIKTDYTITNTPKSITYDGSLLKRCEVLLNSINTSLSFDIYIVNNLDQEFKCTVFIDIPLETENKSIYNGNITLKKDTNFIFYRYK